ncbi:Uncharacterised protein [Sphingobacterium multivorum]|uniref:DUF4834 family protein n=1 Tax=Sphingobacterium multivorum TaxID=28454 RepID=A0A2X2L4D8_SPHMU|nr:hypothetical protein [Sphingobacterium multivorum]SPZ84130.1 Uncharacterised protein [Sphingobacterium multivorum]
MAFLKFILIAFAVYFVVRFLFRLFLPFAMRKAAEKLMKKRSSRVEHTVAKDQAVNFIMNLMVKDNRKVKGLSPKGRYMSITFHRRMALNVKGLKLLVSLWILRK